MAISFQYNKTSLQHLKKQLKIRENALPILKNKEAALRVEVKRARKEAEGVARQLEETLQQHENMAGLWEEFDFRLLEVEAVKMGRQKVAGVSTPVLEAIDFIRHPFSLFNRPAWFPAGMELLKQWIEMALQRKVLLQKMERLEFARKKTTQKVNLYEKVQIPGYEDAIRKIERYLEDEENLAKAAQKIVKKRSNSEAL